MALTEEQFEELALKVAYDTAKEHNDDTTNQGFDGYFDDDTKKFVVEAFKNFLAALPKPKPVCEAIQEPGSAVRWWWTDAGLNLPKGTLLYAESPIAQPASAPSEQKPAAHLSEIYEQMETPFNKLLSAQQRHFLFENEYELKYLPIYADQPDPTYIVKWVWEVRDKHGASVAEAHEWMYQAINNAQVDAIASVKGGE